jgi:hypothetical protein
MNDDTKKIGDLNLSNDKMDMSVTGNDTFSVDVDGIPYFSTPEGYIAVSSNSGQNVRERYFDERGEIVIKGRGR